MNTHQGIVKVSSVPLINTVVNLNRKVNYEKPTSYSVSMCLCTFNSLFCHGRRHNQQTKLQH
jgi:hypothetical protein